MDSDFKFHLRVHSVCSKEKKLIEAFLRERPLDEKKLAQFAKYSVLPDTYRTLVWKVLLNITPRYAESHDYVRQQHKIMFDDLWRTLKTLRLREPATLNNCEHGGGVVNGSNGRLTDTQNPEPEDYLLMWLISEAKLLHNPMSQLRTYDHQRFIIIAHRLSLYFDHPVESFQFFSAIWSLLEKNKPAILAASDEAIALLRKRNDILHLHLLSIGLFSSNILKAHCLSLFCDIFPESAVEKIIDKVISGAFRIIAFVTLSLLDHLKQNLMVAQSVEGVCNCFLQLRKEEADLIVQRALEHWKSQKRPQDAESAIPEDVD